jgi:hypothetical protein
MRAAISPQEALEVQTLFKNASPKAKKYYEITYAPEGHPIVFTDDKVIMKMRRF